MAEERSGGLGEGIRTGIGILSALKEAVEETVEEAIARGDLSPDRARTVVKDAADRLQATLAEARERVDVVPRREFDALRREVEELRRRLDLLTGGGLLGPAPAETTDEPGERTE